jgi:hypothetical protein
MVLLAVRIRCVTIGVICARLDGEHRVSKRPDLVSSEVLRSGRNSSAPEQAQQRLYPRLRRFSIYLLLNWTPAAVRFFRFGSMTV